MCLFVTQPSSLSLLSWKYFVDLIIIKIIIILCIEKILCIKYWVYNVYIKWNCKIKFLIIFSIQFMVLSRYRKSFSRKLRKLYFCMRQGRNWCILAYKLDMLLYSHIKWLIKWSWFSPENWAWNCYTILHNTFLVFDCSAKFNSMTPNFFDVFDS